MNQVSALLKVLYLEMLDGMERRLESAGRLGNYVRPRQMILAEEADVSPEEIDMLNDFLAEYHFALQAIALDFAFFHSPFRRALPPCPTLAGGTAKAIKAVERLDQYADALLAAIKGKRERVARWNGRFGVQVP
jgi:hypothetical protein